ncbi:MAG: hypothetical protein E6H86_14680, partial [Chloroflexi bacterium]
MNSRRTSFVLRTGFSTAAALLILAGASLNAGGRIGWDVALGGLGGLLALAAGAGFRNWRLAVPFGGASLVLTLVIAQFNPRQGDLVTQVVGVFLLGIGGALGTIAYRGLRQAIRVQLDQLGGLNGQLEQKHRAFLVATAEVDGARPGDAAAITSGIASNVGADFACCYLASADGRRFVPQPPGIGVDRLRPQAVNRPHGNAGPLLSAIEARAAFTALDENGLVELINYIPDDFHLQSLIAVPMPIGDHVGGFVVLGRTAGRFSDDDRRLAA